jgi:hypothetical protein
VSVLRTIEQKIEAVFEGIFGRAFKSNVQPVELARKLVKEMDDHKMVSVSRIYAPNEYTVYLCPADREQFETYEASLRTELQDYLADHARRESYILLSPPEVLIETDADLDLGEFGIATRMVQRSRRPVPEAPSTQPEPGKTMVYRSPAPPTGVPGLASLTIDGRRREVDTDRVVIGRAKDCDVQLTDPNVSRRHAELRRENGDYWIVDLGSTNGVEVNGRQLERAQLESGDTITLGSTEIVFEHPET